MAALGEHLQLFFGEAAHSYAVNDRQHWDSPSVENPCRASKLRAEPVRSPSRFDRQSAPVITASRRPRSPRFGVRRIAEAIEQLQSPGANGSIRMRLYSRRRMATTTAELIFTTAA